MPKKVVKKAPAKKVVKKAKTVKVAKVAKTVPADKPTVVGLRVRMTPAIHKQLKKKAKQEGLSQNSLINKLIKES